MNQQSLSSFIWSVADFLRGDYKQSEYGKVILPFTVLRRLDCVLESTKAAVLAEYAAKKKSKLNPEPFLLRKAKPELLQHVADGHEEAHGRPGPHHARTSSRTSRLSRPPSATSSSASSSYTQIDRLAKAGLLYLVTEKFAKFDLHPEKVSNSQMGLRLRRADPQVCRVIKRDRRRAFHPARSHPAHGQSALHRG